MTSTADITTNSNAAILELNSSSAAEGMHIAMIPAPTRQIKALAIGVRNPMIRDRPAIATDAAATVVMASV
jgi:hypothetical protein